MIPRGRPDDSGISKRRLVGVADDSDSGGVSSCCLVGFVGAVLVGGLDTDDHGRAVSCGDERI